MYLKPNPGRSVPDIDRGGLLAAEGREVEPSTYWHRRIVDGDVSEGKAPVVAEPTVIEIASPAPTASK